MMLLDKPVMQKKQFLLAVVVIAIVAIGLGAMPALIEKVYAGNSVSESKNKGKQGDLKSEGNRQGEIPNHQNH